MVANIGIDLRGATSPRGPLRFRVAYRSTEHSALLHPPRAVLRRAGGVVARGGSDLRHRTRTGP